jgi:hypothetical protein
MAQYLVSFGRRKPNLKLLNEDLAENCRQELGRQVRGKPATKGELLEEDIRAMHPLPPQPFEARRVEICQTNSLSLVRFDRNDYSVPTAHAHHAVTAIGGIERVRFVVQDRVVAEHLRDWDKENVHYDPVHYLALLERKPGALDFGKPFDEWDLPEGLRVLRRRLEGELGSIGRREFIKILRLLESWELRELAHAVDRALQIGALTVDAIRLLLQDGQETPVKYFRLDGRPHLEGRAVPPPKLSAYNVLRSAEAQP